MNSFSGNQEIDNADFESVELWIDKAPLPNDIENHFLVVAILKELSKSLNLSS